MESEDIQPQKTIFKRWWFWVIVILVLLIIYLFVSRTFVLKFRNGNKSAVNSSSRIIWQMTNESEWAHTGGTPPTCPAQISPPVDVTKVTSVLYPGQYRGGEYKPHGGFRFDNEKTNNLEVRAPFEAEVFRGARYQAKGDIQYVFDFISPCGYMYRLGHLMTLSPKMQAIADKLPLNGEGDSHDYNINPRVNFQAGEVIATATGMTWGNAGSSVNVFLDWGIYDVKIKNEASKIQEWAVKHQAFTEQHALCWLDLLSPSNEAKIRALPAGDFENGKQSDYCK